MLKEMYYWMMYFLGKIGKTEIFGFNSFLLISTLVFYNILTIVMLFSYVFNINIRAPYVQENSHLIGIVTGVSVVFILYFVLYRRRNEIIEKYNRLAVGRRRLGMLLFWLYCILSCFLVFGVGINLFPTPCSV